MESNYCTTPPFDIDTHLKSPNLTKEQEELRNQLRQRLNGSPLYQEYKHWCTDSQLQRFLIARQFNVGAAYDLMIAALTWRSTRIPAKGGVESLPNWEATIRHESETGKMYIPGYDSYGRPVVVFDNSVQNTNNVDTQLVCLSYNLDTACRLMNPKVTDKYVVFMNLEIFSLFSCPPMKATKETIFMLCSGFPERLGHCIAYKPPSVFKVVFNSVKPLIDPRTAAKLVFITGDVSDGSANDKKLRDIIGDNWKTLTGATQPVLKKGNSPGFDIEKYWPMAMARLSALQLREEAGEGLAEPQNSIEKGDVKKAGGTDSAEIENSSLGEPAIRRIPSSPSKRGGSSSILRSSSKVGKASALEDDQYSLDDDVSVNDDGRDSTIFSWELNRPNCATCNRSFGVLMRRHHCRRCGRCVCHRCSPFRAVLPDGDSEIISPSGMRSSSTSIDSNVTSKTAVRVCRQCLSVITRQLSSGVSTKDDMIAMSTIDEAPEPFQASEADCPTKLVSAVPEVKELDNPMRQDDSSPETAQISSVSAMVIPTSSYANDCTSSNLIVKPSVLGFVAFILSIFTGLISIKVLSESNDLVPKLMITVLLYVFSVLKGLCHSSFSYAPFQVYHSRLTTVYLGLCAHNLIQAIVVIGIPETSQLEINFPGLPIAQFAQWLMNCDVNICGVGVEVSNVRSSCADARLRSFFGNRLVVELDMMSIVESGTLFLVAIALLVVYYLWFRELRYAAI